MARRPRLFGEKLYHHIYAWGNNRQAIFVTDQHYERYRTFLETYSKDYRIDIIAYALMQSHTHLFVYDRLGQVSQFMNSLHGEYAQYYNRVTGQVGHVFGERFNNKVVQVNIYGLWLSRYIHRQAVEAGLVSNPKDYPWSSYSAYLRDTPLGFLKPGVILEQFGTGQDSIRHYEEFVLGIEHGPIDSEIKSLIVIGDEAFKQEVRERETVEDKDDLDDREIFELIAARFKVKPRLLLAPHGWEEKHLRCKIITCLVEEVGLKPVQVARLCRISRMTVQRALNKKVQKVMPVPNCA